MDITEAFDATWEERLREAGYLPPKNEGFFEEAAKGFQYATLKIFAPSEIESNMHLRPSNSLRGDGAAGRFVGQYLGYPLLIASIVAIVVFSVKRIKGKAMREAMNRMKKEERKKALEEALEELQNETMKPAVWAESLIKTNGDVKKAKAYYLKKRAEI